MEKINKIWMELITNKSLADKRKKEMEPFFKCIYRENNEDSITYYRLFYLPKIGVPYDKANLLRLAENKLEEVEMEEFATSQERADKRQEMRLDYKCLSHETYEGKQVKFLLFYFPYHMYSPGEKKRI
jgi:hypothetical protein